MQDSLVLTILGPDRKGIVDSLARAVASCEGSWEDSYLARLAGQFAGIVKVSCPKEQTDALEKKLSGLAAENLTVSVVRENADQTALEGNLFVVDVLGNDRPGILSEVSQTLRLQDANIVEIETQLLPAPESGQMIFNSLATVSLPEGSDPSDVAKALESLSADLQVSFEAAD